MTTVDLPPDVSAALVYADRPPDPTDDRFVDVRPGVGATFDGSRHHVPIHVVGPAGTRRMYDNHEIAAIASAARSHLRERDVSLLRLDDRTRRLGPWWTETVGALERRLLVTARREQATLVTWTDAGPGPRDDDGRGSRGDADRGSRGDPDRRASGDVEYDVVLSR